MTTRRRRLETGIFERETVEAASSREEPDPRGFRSVLDLIAEAPSTRDVLTAWKERAEELIQEAEAGADASHPVLTAPFKRGLSKERREAAMERRDAFLDDCRSVRGKAAIILSSTSEAGKAPPLVHIGILLGGAMERMKVRAFEADAIAGRGKRKAPGGRVSKVPDARLDELVRHHMARGSGVSWTAACARTSEDLAREGTPLGQSQIRARTQHLRKLPAG